MLRPVRSAHAISPSPLAPELPNRTACCGGITTHLSSHEPGASERPQRVGDWDIYLTSEVAAWLDNLQAIDAKPADLVDDAIYALSRSGPTLGRPLVDTIAGSKIKSLKELRPGSSGTSEVRILFAFDPWRSAILLVAGDKLGQVRKSGTGGTPRRSRPLSNCMRST